MKFAAAWHCVRLIGAILPEANVQAPQRIGGVTLASMLGGKVHMGQRVSLAVIR